MNLAEQALKRLGYNCKLEIELVYSGRFKGYNANIKKGRKIRVGLSKKWKDVNKEIQIGIIQKLFCKLFKIEKKTVNMDLYNKFIKKVHMTIRKTKSEPALESSFNRVNERFFNGMIDPTNLVFSKGRRTLGRYDFTRDTIFISRHLTKDREALDYVMFHEMLHKHLKFKSGKRNSYHTGEFKEREKSFPNWEKIEKRLGKL